jgi:ketosteroid isomerase-like protein
MSEGNETIVRRFVDAFNSRDLAVLDELVAEDYINHDPPFPGLPAGREGLKQTIRFMDIFRVAGAQIAERWAVADRIRSGATESASGSITSVEEFEVALKE